MTKEMKLLQAAKDGNTAAFEQIVKKYQSLVCAITFSGTGRVEISEELAQETFLSAWKNLRQLKELSGFRPWLCIIARNMLNRYYRKKKTVPLDPAEMADLSDQTPTPSDNLITQEEHVMLEQALMQIPAEYREPLVMFYRQEKSTKEVAIGLGLKESTVRMRLHRARQMLREEIAARLERTLERTAPDKTFTKAVMAGIGAGLAAGAVGTASAAAAVTGAAGTGTSASTGLAAVMSTVTAKIITAVAVAAIAVGGALTYKHLSQPDPKPTQTDEIALVAAEQDPIPDESKASDSQEIQEVVENSFEPQTVLTSTDMETSKTEIATLSSNAELANTANLDEKNGRLIKVYVTDKETGNPIEKATVYVHTRKAIWTDKNGYCECWWDKNDKEYGKIMPVWVRKDGYVRMSYSVRSENSPGDAPIEIHYSLEKGITVGGIVQNADGENMAGIELTVRVNDDEHMEKPENHVKQGVTTDENGRWETPDCVPAQLERVNLRTKHADYSDQNVWLETPEDIQLLREKEYVLVVDEGYSISGTVKDEAGNPIKGARAQLGDYFFKDRQHCTYTDENGCFDFKQLRIGNSGPHYEFVEGQGNISVRRRFEYFAVMAEGFAPQTMTIYFKEKHVGLEFVMTPGDPIHGCVLDFEGNPVAGATVRADNWGPQSYDHVRTIDWNTQTDGDGRFIWEHAPSIEIQFEINKDGYLDLRTEKVKPSETEYEFILNPKVRVIGQVIDAVTKESVTEFIFRRYEGGYISTPRTIKDSAGRFETAFADQGETFTISFEAKGYKPVNSRKITLTEQDVELVIEMQPDAGLDGVVVDTEGTPVEGVRVLVPGSFLTIDNLKYEGNWLRDIPNTETDQQGHFHLDPVASDTYGILALEETGYLFMSSDNFPENGVFVLQPYGRIEGTYYKGSRPVVNERIRIDFPKFRQVNKGNGVWQLGPAFNFYTQTDEQGRFVFDKLIHGTARILIDPYREVEIQAGQTHEIHIGGDGLTVQGHLLNPDGEPLNEDVGKCFLEIRKIYDSLPIPEEDFPLPDGADAMTYTQLMGWFTEFGDSDEGRQWQAAMEQKYGDLTGSHRFEINYKGRFEVPNVTPGTYMLSVSVRPWQNPDQYPRQPDYNTVIAQASAMFIVPEFDTVEEMDIPVDLGTLQCRPAPLAAGQKAPDFEIENLKAPGKIRLSDYRGKTVLVNFTNPALKESEPEKAAILEQLCQQAKGKVTIINVAMEMLPWDTMRQKMIPECTLPGVYGVAIAHNSKIDADYKTRHTVPLPYSVLINPAGTILWIGSPSEGLLQEIDTLIH